MVARALETLIALAMGVGVCACAGPAAEVSRGTPKGPGPRAGQLDVEQAPGRTPAVRAEIPWATPSATNGLASVRLWGRPTEDELEASMIIDARSTERRWAACGQVMLFGAGGELALPARYVGASLSQGHVYDAVRVRVPIERLRALSLSEEVRGDVCGDGFVLDVEQRATLRRFVETFDRLAMPAGGVHDTWTHDGPELLLPGEDEEIWPTEA